MIRRAEFQTSFQTSWRLSQKCDLNLVSLSDTILTETPCNRTISLMYLSARSSVDCPTLNGMKCADLVRRSTTTHTALFPFELRGRAVKKSIVTCSHFHSDIGKGCSNPAGLWCSTFTCWHIDTLPHIVRSLSSSYSTRNVTSDPNTFLFLQGV